MNRSKLTPALIGGCTFGVAAALPYLSYVNSVCCAVYIGGGALAAYLYLRDLPPAPNAPYGDGAVVGLLSGLLGGVASTVVGLILSLAGLGPAAAARTQLQQVQQTGVELPEWFLEMMGMYGVTPLMAAGQLALNCVTYAVAACIGAVVGVAIFRKKEA